MDIAAHFREYVGLDRKRTGDGLTPAELTRFCVLKQYLHTNLSNGQTRHVDTRRSVRVPTRVNVTFATDGAFAKSLMTNISRHGVFVQTDHPQEIGSRFDLRIEIEKPLRVITVPVEVVTTGLGPSFEAVKPGMGLRFLDVEPDVQKQLQALYEHALT